MNRSSSLVTGVAERYFDPSVRRRNSAARSGGSGWAREDRSGVDPDDLGQ
jgi:hypothetical protein